MYIEYRADTAAKKPVNIAKQIDTQRTGQFNITKQLIRNEKARKHRETNWYAAKKPVNIAKQTNTQRKSQKTMRNTSICSLEKGIKHFKTHRHATKSAVNIAKLQLAAKMVVNITKRVACYTKYIHISFRFSTSSSFKQSTFNPSHEYFCTVFWMTLIGRVLIPFPHSVDQSDHCPSTHWTKWQVPATVEKRNT